MRKGRKMEFKIIDRVINELTFKNKNIILPWGIETADMDSFFSLEKGIGYRYEEGYFKEDFSRKQYHYETEIKMKFGHWKLEGTEHIENDSQIVREATLTCLEDTWLMDFVMRFRFPREQFSIAEIAGKTIEFQGTNIYHQYPIDEVYLSGKTLQCRIKVIDKRCHKKLQPVMYVRDSNHDEWIVHVRMIPVCSDIEIIKLCNSWYKTKAIPHWLSRIILKSEYLKKRLWYAGERKEFKSKLMRFINPNAFPMVRLKKGERLTWKVLCEFRELNSLNAEE